MNKPPMADTPDNLRDIGNQMANVMFNLAQRPGEPLTGDVVATMDSLRKQWDAARRAPAIGAVPELPEPWQVRCDWKSNLPATRLMVDAMKAEIADLRAQLESTTANLHAAVQEAWRANAANTETRAQLAAKSQGAEAAVRDAFALAWGQALSDAAFYVAGHCHDGDHHVDAIMTLRAPALKYDESVGAQTADRAVPDVLFDGHAVYESVMANDPHTPRPTADNVSDVLDAVVRLLRTSSPTQSGAQPQEGEQS